MLHDYVDASVFSSAPAVVINSGNKAYQLAMYLNGTLGCCTCSAIGNTLRVNSHGKLELPNGAIQTAYVAVTTKEGNPYNPKTGKNADAGCIPLDVLDYWVSVGVGGDHLVGHAGIDMSNPDEVRWAMWKTGSVYQGIQLATEQQNQTVWDYVKGSKPGSWGGHLFPLFDRPQPNRWRGGTWGGYKEQTDAFMAKQADEGHALITDAFLSANADVVNVAQLKADLADLTPES